MNEADRATLELFRVELIGRLNVIDTKLDGVVKVGADHEDRIRKNEKWRNALPVSLILFMATTALAVVGLFIRG